MAGPTKRFQPCRAAVAFATREARACARARAHVVGGTPPRGAPHGGVATVADGHRDRVVVLPQREQRLHVVEAVARMGADEDLVREDVPAAKKGRGRGATRIREPMEASRQYGTRQRHAMTAGKGTNRSNTAAGEERQQTNAHHLYAERLTETFELRTVRKLIRLTFMSSTAS